MSFREYGNEIKTNLMEVSELRPTRSLSELNF